MRPTEPTPPTPSTAEVRAAVVIALRIAAAMLELHTGTGCTDPAALLTKQDGSTPNYEAAVSACRHALALALPLPIVVCEAPPGYCGAPHPHIRGVRGCKR